MTFPPRKVARPVAEEQGGHYVLRVGFIVRAYGQTVAEAQLAFFFWARISSIFVL